MSETHKQQEQGTTTAVTAGPTGPATTRPGPRTEAREEARNETVTKATNAAERRAGELGVDLARVEATGANGQATIEDVEKAALAQMEAFNGARAAATDPEADPVRATASRVLLELDAQRRNAQRRGEAAYANGVAQGYYAVEEIVRALDAGEAGL